MKDDNKHPDGYHAAWNWPDKLPARHEASREALDGALGRGRALVTGQAPPGGPPYPVWDPARTDFISGSVAWGFAWDGILVTLEEDPNLTQCEMRIGLQLPSAGNTDWFQKEIAEWNVQTGTFGQKISSQGRDYALKTMVIKKARGTTRCDTIVLSKGMFANVLTPLYSFQVDPFWSRWAGKRVTFVWVDDHTGSNIWGDETVLPEPWVHFADRTLVRTPDGATDACVGGALFPVADASTASSIGLDFSVVQDITAGTKRNLLSAPIDFTYLREPGNPNLAHIVFGRARFAVTLLDSQTYFSNWPFSKAVWVPNGTVNQIPTMPMKGTLLQESTSTTTFAVVGGVLRPFSSSNRIRELCFDPRRIRWVPPGALQALPKGPPL